MAFMGKEVKNAIITCPTDFKDSQWQAKRHLGNCWLNHMRIINEPTAAAIAYGLDKRSQGERKVLFFDLRRDDDVSLLTFDSAVFEVEETSGDARLRRMTDSRMVTSFITRSN